MEIAGDSKRFNLYINMMLHPDAQLRPVESQIFEGRHSHSRVSLKPDGESHGLYRSVEYSGI